jgi:hypothetical protein
MACSHSVLIPNFVCGSECAHLQPSAFIRCVFVLRNKPSALLFDAFVLSVSEETTGIFSRPCISGMNRRLRFIETQLKSVSHSSPVGCAEIPALRQRARAASSETLPARHPSRLQACARISTCRLCGAQRRSRAIRAVDLTHRSQYC